MAVEGALHPMNIPTIRIPALVCAAALLAAACGGGSSKPAATATPKQLGPLDALADWVRANRNVDFVGDCSSAKPGVDVGKTCSALLGTRGTRSAYSIGPTFSEGTALAILEQEADGWTVLSVTNRDPSAPAVPGIAWPLQVGDQVIVIGLGDPDCLRIREQPTQQGKQLGCEYDGTKAIVQEGPVEAETFTWWRIAGDGFNGWAAGTWLRLPESIAQALATPTPAP
jgi:hypothetical protein